MKIIKESIIVLLIVICMLSTNVYAYENSIFKMDLPSEFVEMSYGGIYMFSKSKDTSIIVYTIESTGLKKDISTMSKAEVKELVDKIIEDDITVIEQGKEKLGKSKAIKIRATDDEVYIDMYVVVSDKHILLVCFSAESENELEGIEYMKIKKSFEMKEKTTNVSIIKIFVGIIIVVSVVLKIKRHFNN